MLSKNDVSPVHLVWDLESLHLIQHLTFFEKNYNDWIKSFYKSKWTGLISQVFSRFLFIFIFSIKELNHRFFSLFCTKLKIMSSNQKRVSQIFDICCKNISFSPGFELPKVSAAGKKDLYSLHFDHFLFNFNLKNQSSSNLSSLESQDYSGSQEMFLLCIPTEKQKTLSRGPTQAYSASKTIYDSQSFSFGLSSKFVVSECSPGIDFEPKLKIDPSKKLDWFSPI